MHLAHWSIAQTKNRETEPEGLGWELFKNYLVALEKFKPDYFLYENNKSMSPAIRAQITKELGVEPILINSALVSAQNRQRLYWTNIPGVEQPEDLGILLRDILESGVPIREKGYTLKANYFKSSAINAVDGGHFPAPMAAEPLATGPCGKAYTITTACCRAIPEDTIKRHRHTMVAEPVRIGTIESAAKNADFDSQQYRVYSPDGKSVTLCGQGGGMGAKTGLYATPVRVGDMPNAEGQICGSQSKRIYSVDGKAKTICASGSGGNSDMSSPATGLYAVPYNCDVIITDNSIRCRQRDKKHSMVQGSHVNFEDGKSQTLSHSHIPQVIEANYEIIDGAEILISNGKIRQGDGKGSKQGKYVYTELANKSNTISAGQAHNEKVLVQAPDGTWKNIYEVCDGMITIKDKQYPIKLADGFYIIRKLTVTECSRLQTVPEWYFAPHIFRVKDVFLTCKDAPFQVVRIPLCAEKQGCVISITCDFKGMEVLNCNDPLLTKAKNVSWMAVIDVSKQTLDTVLCTISDLNGSERSGSLAKKASTLRAMTNIDSSVEELMQKCLEGSLNQEKSSIISTLIQQITTHLTSMSVMQENTRVSIGCSEEKFADTFPNSLTLDISYSTEKNMKLVSDSACYKMLGNGWTVDVIAHILSYCPEITTEPLEVLSMYDGMSCGHLALDKLGANIERYYATEIDKYAIKTTQYNFPDAIQLGDAFQVREEGWTLG